ncbi:MAG: glycosyltransferase family 4 protein [Chloroflexi bacterium]|nr:glycosyltransferase family 4 protein [Chloroflexota bacterium]
MRICTLVDRFPPLVGGVENQAKQLSVELARRGLPVIVLTRRVSAHLPAYERTDGLTIYRVPPSGERGHRLNIISVFTFAWALLRHRREYDLIHAHDMFSLLLAAIIVRLLLRKPLVVKVPTHGNISRQGSQTTQVSLYSRLLHHVILPQRLWYWLLNRADVFIAISNEIEAELRAAQLTDKTVRMVNAVDRSRFRPAEPPEKQSLRQQLDLPPEATVIVSHGRIVRRKRLDVLIHAIAQVCQTHPDLFVVLLGPFAPPDSALEAELRHLIAELGLEHQVRFIGETLSPEGYLRAADVFVLTSEREGMPNALLEAMACGLPCCASTIGGITDVVDHGTDGYLFPVGDATALAQVLKLIIDEPDFAARLGTAALATIGTAYTWDAVIARYEELYRGLLSSESTNG